MKLLTWTLFVIAVVTVTVSSTLAASIKEADDDFDYLILAQFWPMSSCVYFHEHGGSCYIPPKVRGWTIHGLWPSRPGTEKPQFCNSSMTFNYTKIESLGSQLDLNWHFYNKDQNSTYLWNHEWTKHGTCAVSLPAISGEFAFFNKTLNLYSSQNMTKALAVSGIVPSNTKTYNMVDINNAVKSFYKIEPVIVCDYDKKSRKTYLDQIYLCYDKSFNLRDCYKPAIRSHPLRKPSKVSFYSMCEEQDEILYLPIMPGPGKAASLTFQSEKLNH